MAEIKAHLAELQQQEASVGSECAGEGAGTEVDSSVSAAANLAIAAQIQRHAGVIAQAAAQIEELQAEVELSEAEARTAHNDHFFLQIAFNYGGQADITDAARRFAEAVAKGDARPEDLTEAVFARHLSTGAAPPPDLIVRPSGEQRLSNFLLWEAAYAELVFQDVLWPDYGPEHLKAALAEFSTRDRRYGGAVADDALAAG